MTSAATIRIDQVMAGFADGDAISHEAVLLRDIFRRWGHPSDIFVDPQLVSPSLRGDVRPLAEYRAAARDICLHHYGIVSPAAAIFQAAPARRILIYHNITPAHYMKGYDDMLADRLTEARRVLFALARSCEAVWAASQFDADELTAEHVPAVRVLPLPLSWEQMNLPPDVLVTGKFTVKLTTILFVGRLAPNKRVEDLIQAFAWYNQAINPYSRLVIVGSPRSVPRYFTMLRMLVGDLDLPNVCFEGFASPAGLEAYYRVADLYVSTSEHEGYGLPLVEAMCHGVPVIARAVGGTPEAMDGAGVLYEDLEPAELAVLMDRVLTDRALRGEILASQQERVQRARARDLEAEVKTLMAGML